MNLRQIAAHMRNGAKLRPQVKRRFFFNGGSCAIGAALESMGQSYVENAGSAYFGCTNPSSIYIAFRDSITDEIIEHIWKMNDTIGNSREEIATWLESQEPDDKAAFDAFMDKLQAVTV